MALIGSNVFDGAQIDYRVIKVTTGTSATTGDTIEVDLSEYGAAGIDSVQGFHHSTTDSVVVEEAPTTSVTDGVLTITVGGTTSTGKKVYLVSLSN